MAGILKVALLLFVAFAVLALACTFVLGPLGVVLAFVVMAPIALLAGVVVFIVKIVQVAK